MWKQYKKDATVSAFQFREKWFEEELKFIQDEKIPITISVTKEKGFTFYLETLEGKHELRDKDYICKGSKGEFWNVKKEIFEDTYSEFKELQPLSKWERIKQKVRDLVWELFFW